MVAPHEKLRSPLKVVSLTALHFASFLNLCSKRRNNFPLNAIL